MRPEFKKVLVDQANDAQGPPPVASWDSCSKYVDEAIQKVVLQSADSQNELDVATAELNRFLKR